MRSASGQHTARTGGQGVRGRGNNYGEVASCFLQDGRVLADRIPEATGHDDTGGRVGRIGGRLVAESSAVGSAGATSIIPQKGSGRGGGRGGRSGGRCHHAGNAGPRHSTVLSSAASVVDVASPHHQQRKKNGFNVGDTCFTDVGGAFHQG